MSNKQSSIMPSGTRKRRRHTQSQEKEVNDNDWNRSDKINTKK